MIAPGTMVHDGERTMSVCSRTDEAVLCVWWAPTRAGGTRRHMAEYTDDELTVIDAAAGREDP